MKKKLLPLIVSLLVVALFAGPILAADVSNAIYTSTIAITNESGDSKPYAVVLVPLDTDYYVEHDYTTDDFSDTVVIDGAGGDIPFMAIPGQSNIVIGAGPISSHQTLNNYLYSATATGGRPVYFPGPGGMTVSDNGNMELGGNFAMSISPVRPASNGDIVRKDDAFAITCGDNNIYAGIIADNTSAQTSGSEYDEVYSGRRSGQRIDGFLGTISEVQIYLIDVGPTTDVYYVRVRSASDDSILGTLATGNASAAWHGLITLNTDNYTSYSPTDIRITFEYATGDSGHNVRVCYNSSDTVDGVQTYYDGSTYTDNSGGDSRMTITMTKFEIMLSAAVEAGEHDIEVVVEER